jgi:hypothetical protein
MRYRDIITEAERPIDKLAHSLAKVGFEETRIDSQKTISVFVPAQQRMEVLNQIVDYYDDAVHDKNFSGSSIGAIRMNDMTIRIRPTGKSGGKSAGLMNEQNFIDSINSFANEVGPLNIKFLGKNGVDITVDGVTEAKGVGAEVTDRSKSDVILIAGNSRVPISIKQSNAAYWESADTYFGDTADKIVTYLEDREQVKLQDLETERPDGTKFVKITPEIAVEATPEETLNVIFGNDILANNGAIVKQTFANEHYKLDGNHLTIEVNMVIKKPEDIPEENKVFFLIRNDRTRRRPRHKYPGLRVLAAYKTRINKNTLVFDRNKIS